MSDKLNKGGQFPDIGLAIAGGGKLRLPAAWGMTRDMGDQVGAWWEEEREFIQPSEFFITGSGKVLASTYSSSPIGRMDPEDAVTLAKFIIKKG